MKKELSLALPSPGGVQPESTPRIDGAFVRQAMLQKYRPTDPMVMLGIELTAQATDDWQAIREAQLDPNRGFIILDREARPKQQAARHLRDMLLSLRDLLRNPPPSAEVTP